MQCHGDTAHPLCPAQHTRPSDSHQHSETKPGMIHGGDKPAAHHLPPPLQVVLHPGPRLASLLPLHSGEPSSLRVEYGGLECTIELVDSLQEAINHINTYSSAHTDCIVTENGQWFVSS